jgi:oligopeptide transport system substrate-binding protein
MLSKLTKLVAGAALAGLLTSAAFAEVVYYRGNDGDPETLDQHKTSTVAEAHLLRDLYEGLVIYDPKAQIIPGVAESWSVSDDQLVYTFKLREDAKWSNGDPVVADDFVFSLRRIQNPETAAEYANVLYPIKNAEKVNKGEVPPEEIGVKAVDDHTLEITLENPTPYFLELLTHQTALPVHPASVEQYGNDFVKPGNMVSNGAYVLVEFLPNDHITMEKNPQFHDADSVQIDRVVFIPFEDRAACVRRFEAGEVQSCSDLPTEQLPQLREKFGDQVNTPPYLGVYYYTFKTDKPPFDDVRVRQALAMVIDRDFLASEIWANSMLPGYSLVPPGTSNYGEPAYVEWKDTDLLDREDEAKRLLEEAGFNEQNPLDVEIRYNTSENHANTATAIADMWKPLGVNTTFVNTDLPSHYALLKEKGDYDVARAGWIADYNDPQNFLFLLESDNSGFNYANYNNPEYDALMNEAEATADLEARAKLLQQAEALFARDLPYIPLLYYSSHSLVSDKLKGWEDNIQDVHATRFLSLEQ